MPTIDNLTPGELDQDTDLIVGWDAATRAATKITKSQLAADLNAPTADEKASFPSGASGADPLALAAAVE